MPLAFVEGSIYAQMGRGMNTDKYVAQRMKQLKASDPKGDPAAHLKQIMGEPGYQKIQKGTDINQSGINNMLAWTREGQKTITGRDILNKANPALAKDQGPAGFLAGLAVDIFADPLTHGLGKLATVGSKAAATGAKTSLQAGKLLITEGKGSTRIALKGTEGDARKAVRENAAPLKEGASILDQYTGKPVIATNLKRTTGPMAARLEQADVTLTNKYLYTTSPIEKSFTNMAASMLEAGWKGAVARVVLEGTKTDLTKIAKFQVKVAKLESKGAKKALKKAPQIVDETGTIAEVKPYVPHVSPDGVHVYDGKNLHAFKNEQDAVDWVKAQKEAPAPSDGVVPVTHGANLVIDTAPINPVDAIVKRLPATTTVAKDGKALLTKIENIAKKTVGVTAGENLSSKIGEIINRADGNVPVSTFAKQTLTTVIKNGGDGFAAINNLKGKGGAPEIARILLGRELLTKTGKKFTIERLMSEGVTWEQLGKNGQANVAKMMKNLLTPAKDAASSKLAELTKIAGKDVADRIAATGILEGKTVSKKVIDEIINSLPSGTEKTYKGFMDLIDGIKSGDVVDVNVLQKLVKAIDPENAVLAQVSKAAAEKTPRKQLENILTNSGVETVMAAKRRLELLDSTVLMKALGIGNADVLAVYAENRLAGRLDPDQAIIGEARAQAQNNIADLTANNEKELFRTLESIAEGFGTNFKYWQDIIDSPDVLVNVTTLKEMAARNTKKAYQAETKAILLNQINQSGEAKIMGHAFGIIRNDLSFAKNAAGKSIKRIPTPDEILNKFISRGQNIEDAMLATTGGRITWRKTAALAKGEQHYIYSSIPKLAEIFAETPEGRAAFIKAMIPDTNIVGIQKYDALSFVGVAKAARSIIEAKERNIAVDMKQVIKDLKSRGETQREWSPKFKTQVDKIVNEFAAHLTKSEVVDALQQVHISRAKAAMEDSMKSADSIVADVYDSLVKGWKANLDKGIDSTAARAQLVRDHFNHFVYASGIFLQQDSHVAEAVFLAASRIFVKNGRLAKLIEDSTTVPMLIGSPVAKEAADRELFAQIQEEIASFYKHQNAENNIGAGRIPFPDKTAIAKVTDKLTELKLAYEEHMGQRANIVTKANATAWAKRYTTLQNKLDAARAEATDLGMQTQHWDDGQWVPSHLYDHASAQLRANESANALIVTSEGMVKAVVSDTLPVAQKISIKESKQMMAKWVEQNNAKMVDRATGDLEDNANNIINQIPFFEQLGLTAAETADRIYNESIMRTFSEAKIYVITSLNESSLSAGNKAAEMVSATANKQDLRSLISKAESGLMNDISNIDSWAHRVRRKYNPTLHQSKNLDEAALNAKGKLTAEQFREGFRLALSKGKANPSTSPVVLEFVKDLNAMLDPLFRSAETSKLIEDGITPAQLHNGFAKYGLVGPEFMPTTKLDPNNLVEYVKHLPFADVPKTINGRKLTKDAIQGYADRAKQFEESGIDPIVVLTRIAHAVQFTKMENVMARDFTARFGYKAWGLTYDQAVAKGWVKPVGISHGGTNLTELLPTPADGGLFHPQIAEQYLATNREWAKLFYPSQAAPLTYLATNTNAARTLMNVVGVLKISETIMRAGHHVLNAVGDFSTAITAGARNPKDLIYALALAKRFAQQDVLAAVAKNNLDKKLVRALEGFEIKDKGFEVKDAQGMLQPAIAIETKNGKTKLNALDLNDIATRFQQRNIISGSIVTSDTQGLIESVIAEPGVLRQQGSKTAELRQIIAAKARQGLNAVEKPLGSATAYYSNASRAFHAMHVIRSRSWKSLDEALDAAAEQVNRYHPTITSLAASERGFPRLAFSYYTWQRGAYTAMIDMLVNHTAAMMVPLKVQYNLARNTGIQPLSIGTPWEDQTNTPQYLNQSVYGPTEKTPQGEKLYKRGFLVQDVADNFNLTWDFAFTPSENIANNTSQSGGILKQAGRYLGKNTNMVAQHFGEYMTGSDWQTGGPSQIKNLADLGDAFLSDIGPVTLLRGLGQYTPQNKLPQNNKTNPQTKQQEQLILENWLGGQRGQLTQTPQEAAFTNKEQNARLKSFLEIMNGQKK
jgi:hypothetical protein